MISELPKQHSKRVPLWECYPQPASDERVQGVLENVFGVKIPQSAPFESDEEQKYAGSLENIYGVKLPSDMVSRAYSIFIKEYKSKSQQ
jgi:hypothetical protein